MSICTYKLVALWSSLSNAVHKTVQYVMVLFQKHSVEIHIFLFSPLFSPYHSISLENCVCSVWKKTDTNRSQKKNIWGPFSLSVLCTLKNQFFKNMVCPLEINSKARSRYFISRKEPGMHTVVKSEYFVQSPTFTRTVLYCTVQYINAYKVVHFKWPKAWGHVHCIQYVVHVSQFFELTITPMAFSFAPRAVKFDTSSSSSSSFQKTSLTGNSTSK